MTTTPKAAATLLKVPPDWLDETPKWLGKTVVIGGATAVAATDDTRNFVKNDGKKSARIVS